MSVKTLLKSAVSQRFRRPKGPREVLVYSRPGCHLCEEAIDVLRRLERRYPMVIQEVDIRSDPELLRRYDIRIPVVVIDGRIEIEAPIRENELVRAFRE